MKMQRSTADGGAKWTTPFSQGIAYAGNDGMKGAGYHDQNSTVQRASIQLVLDW